MAFNNVINREMRPPPRGLGDADALSLETRGLGLGLGSETRGLGLGDALSSQTRGLGLDLGAETRGLGPQTRGLGLGDALSSQTRGLGSGLGLGLGLRGVQGREALDSDADFRNSVGNSAKNDNLSDKHARWSSHSGTTSKMSRKVPEWLNE